MPTISLAIDNLLYNLRNEHQPHAAGFEPRGRFHECGNRRGMRDDRLRWQIRHAWHRVRQDQSARESRRDLSCRRETLCAMPNGRPRARRHRRPPSRPSSGYQRRIIPGGAGLASALPSALHLPWRASLDDCSLQLRAARFRASRPSRAPPDRLSFPPEVRLARLFPQPRLPSGDAAVLGRRVGMLPRPLPPNAANAESPTA